MTADRPVAPASREEAAVRLLAQQTFSRVAGAPLIEGNAVELLIDGRANFDAWLAAIRGARTSILLENYIFDDDALCREFRDALAERAAAGVRVCVIRDWLGCLGKSRDHIWRALRMVGGEVRTYNPFSVASPFGWVSRDHRKLLVVDSEVGFVSGVCISKEWLGDPARGTAAWRDTGIALRGPAVRDLAVAFADNWASLGDRLPARLSILCETPPIAGDTAVRVVATLPSTAGLYRLDQMLTALARRTLWLTDAYFIGTSPYVQGLAAAARDGVDVRLLVPGSSDLPVVGALSRTGYRSLLAAGVRVYEWNGPMLHAKSAVVDGRWARVGSSNLNIASWMGNCELDVAFEDEAFARRMEAQYEEDLRGATEVVLRSRRRGQAKGSGPSAGSGGAAAGALRLANTVGAAITNRRVLGSSEAGILLGGALVLLATAGVALYWPRALAWPLAALALWSAFGVIVRYIGVVRRARSRRRAAPAPARTKSQ
ncbi:phospholipase D-like domain-containing protein [Nannocystis sp. ILAH1]|uniref:phospholipase D-like domain-containing protein n=1 Tax=unclassified Nannocystis TaxID=2627009 RepID=UPI00226DC362|nr:MULTISPECIES: phospholipase D-like domain-containing protein [unclassified Nannocystis]MCY0986521.1 phospholipase D-like domain-containing protein [Nannocystis sp. ILAH1]MCY0989194.1 phospholipase D-like domain-containing protein [Nannocystis sp. ILAH1]MCY1071396.1 phospholipase D-like domain-containing protein [Nannocystis sp. RBIL2]